MTDSPKADRDEGESLDAAYDRALALSRVGGNPSIADELLQLMLTELPDQRRELLEYYAAGEHTDLRRVAHRLRGSSACCGMRALEQACHAVELAVDNGFDADLPFLVAALVEQVDRVLALLPPSSS